MAIPPAYGEKSLKVYPNPICGQIQLAVERVRANRGMFRAHFGRFHSTHKCRLKRKPPPIGGGLKISLFPYKLSKNNHFSTIFPVYPQFSTSYPQFLWIRGKCLKIRDPHIWRESLPDLNIWHSPKMLHKPYATCFTVQNPMT